MNERLQIGGNGAGINDDKSIPETVNIVVESDPKSSMDDTRLLIAPGQTAEGRTPRMAWAQARTLKGHDATFRKLAE